MTFSDYAIQIKALGREINTEALGGTRAVIEPLIPDTFLDGIIVTRDIAYGDHERHSLDVFTVEGDENLKPVLLFVHGGGFIAGDKHTDGSPYYSNIGAWAANNGFAGVNMTYRLAPDNKWPAGSEDICKAIEFIQGHDKEYGLDADNLFLMGQSSGGAHAAGYLAHPEIYGNRPHGVKGIILLSAVYDYVTMPTTTMEQAYLGEDDSLYFERSALAGLLEVDIPVLISTAENDPPKFQAQALQFLNAWQGKKGEMPGYVHMLGQNHLSVALYLGLPEDQLAPQLLRFITENLG
jgi:triacylglycerol lipase